MIGKTLAHYEILEKIGAGGMGEVYRARDSQLDREVAVKILPGSVAGDPESLARFKQEAKTLAAVNHPGIATVFGLHEQDGIRFMAMELVPGTDLSQRISRRALPTGDALQFALQIAEALEAAHEQGIIHRDLKPQNLMVTPDGKIKVLDFGLARVLTRRSISADDDPSPTITAALTQPGTVMGTPAYMSPEQVQGEVVDARGDIWAFGAVVYEMLTGKRAFGGKNVSETMYKVMASDPDLSILPASLPAGIRRLVRRCLVKEARNRLQSIGDARIAIQEYLDDPSPAEEERVHRSVWRMVPWILLPFIAVGAWFLKPQTTPLSTLQVEVSMPDGMWFRSPGSKRRVAISPDGRTLAFRAGELKPEQAVTRNDWLHNSRLYLRQLDQTHSRLIPGSKVPGWPVFSPDGRWLAFTMTSTNGPELKKVAVDGGESITLWEMPNFWSVFGVSWSSEGKFAIGSLNAGLLALSAAGGEPDTLTWVDKDAGEHSHRLPHFLPDGRTVLFTAVSHHLDIINWDRDARIYAFSLDTGKKKLLIEGGSDARYIPSGHIVFARNGQIMAVRFDVKSLTVSGAAIRVLDGVGHCINSPWSGRESGAAQFVVSRTGLLAYAPGPLQPRFPKSVVWVDREGSEEPIAVPPSNYGRVRISPDGRELLMTHGAKVYSVWTFDLEREVMRRQTFEGNQLYAEWGPSAGRITFDSDVEGPRYLFTKDLDSGPGNTQKLWDGQGLAGPNSCVLEQGKVVFVTEKDGETKTLITSADSQTEVFLGSRAKFPAFSPDGRWLAYTSDQSGRDEVYVRHYPDNGQEVLISNDGGVAPIWSRDGAEIFYKSLGEETQILAASVEVTGDGLRPGRPKKLFHGSYVTSNPTRSYDVGADGRFLMIKQTPDSTVLKLRDERVFDHIRLVQNWFAEIEAKFQDSH